MFQSVIDYAPRIFGGSPASDGLAPYQCSIQKKEKWVNVCGCAVLSLKWIITTSHCFRYVNNVLFFVKNFIVSKKKKLNLSVTILFKY